MLRAFAIVMMLIPSVAFGQLPEGGDLPGQEISRPLQPIVAPQAPAPAPLPSTGTLESDIPAAPRVEEILERKGLPQSWSRYELLMWYPKAMPLPPLLTAAPTGAFPQLGGASTTLLAGGQSLDTPMSAGGRFVWGWAKDDGDWGWEMCYFFTGTRTARLGYDGRFRDVTLGRPVVDALAGIESVVPVSAVVAPGQFVATSTNRMTGWEVNGVWNLGISATGYLNLVGGYRYFQNHEGVRLEQTTITNLGNGSSFWMNSADQFDAHTRFHGGQIGLEFGRDWNRFFIEGVTKVAFGRSDEIVKIGGQTNFGTIGFPLTAAQGGMLSSGPNAGRRENSAFAVLPEGSLRVGYRFRDRSRFYVGYNVIYLSDAVRAGDQIDRRIGFANAAANTVPILAPLRGVPDTSFTRTDFWAQGLTLGLEWTY
jgi:hypothetical protein